MKSIKNVNSTENILVFLYFTLAFVDLILQFLMCNPILSFVKPLVIFSLMVLYWWVSHRRNPLFFVLFSFMLVSKIYIIYDDEEMLFLAMVYFMLYRVVMIYYIEKLIKIKDYFPIVIVMIPFLFFFIYFLSLTNNLSEKSYYSLIFQFILMSLLISITISNYVMNKDKKSFWLFIFGLLSVMQYFIVFIDRFYLQDLSPIIFKPMLVILTNSACYTFYKYVIITEKSNNN